MKKKYTVKVNTRFSVLPVLPVLPEAKNCDSCTYERNFERLSVLPGLGFYSAVLPLEEQTACVLLCSSTFGTVLPALESI